MGNESRKRAAERRRSEIRLKTPASPPPDHGGRFVADVMLGRLAKWLRIAGFDVLYSNRYSDDEIVMLAQREERTILSRDTRLLVRKSVKKFIFLESEKIDDQVRQILSATRTTRLPELLGRCVLCNHLLAEISREEVRAIVPPYVYQTQTHYKECPECRRVYWAGSHRQSIVRRLERLLV
jgi:uncharacterized protein with PIN domain